MTLSVEDRLDIQQLLNLYGHVIDERQFSRLGELFTDDAVFDLQGFDGTRFEGLAAIAQMLRESQQHPLAHHATNVVLESADDGVRALSKGIGVGAGGRVGSVTYRDSLLRTDAGWRIRERVCALRTVESIPEPG
jgi:hypothetical protein